VTVIGDDTTSDLRIEVGQQFRHHRERRRPRQVVR
jgi:hypothetical protein